MSKKLYYIGGALAGVPVVSLVFIAEMRDCFVLPEPLRFLYIALDAVLLTFPVLTLLLIFAGILIFLTAYTLQRKSKGVSGIGIATEIMVMLAALFFIISISLASLNTTRSKGRDAAVKSTVNNLRAQAELYYDKNGESYDGVCTSPEFLAAKEQIVQTVHRSQSFLCKTPPERAAICIDDRNGFAVSGQVFKAEGGQHYYCADSTGFAGEVGTQITGPSCK